jgi:UDP-N-acetylglucosamine 1-carboxyvinyltransferase
MLDRYWSGETARISPEAPVPVVQIKHTDHRPGGAANVALNILALGAKVTLLGVTGLDEAGQILRAQLQKAQLKADLHESTQVETIVKLRILSRHQQLIRIDFEKQFANEEIHHALLTRKFQAFDKTTGFAVYFIKSSGWNTRMDRIRIVGGNKLNGTIPISGAKNAALPLMIAGLLTEETLILDNVPRLADVAQLQRILGNHGVDITSVGKRVGDREYQGQTLHISASDIIDTTAPYELVSRMRASFWVIAPLVARMRQARVSLPGGCAIGTRPVDLLMMALEKLGADISIDRGYVIAGAPNGLRGGRIDFPKVTVSGTHVALMAASLARGSTVIDNAACEPEIADVASCLNKMGAHIEGAGTPRITVEGVARLHGAQHTVLPDRIEAGTYAIAATMTGGDVQLAGARPELLQSALDVLKRAGAEISVNDEGIRVARNGAGIRPVTVSTAPFPGFPTDLQAQLMALMVRAQGASEITETIFENRFMHVQELARFGARIRLEGETARIDGIAQLRGAPVMATDLRASVSLVIAGLAAEGETMVNRVYPLYRGFERLEGKLKACGASIRRIGD